MRRQGTTLVEVLVVSTLLSLVLGMVCSGLVMAYRAQARTEKKTESYRAATLTASKLERELNTCRSLLSPLPVGAGLTTPLAGNPLRFVRSDAGSALGLSPGVTVSYYFDPQQRAILRSDSSNPRVKAVAQEVQSFTVDVVPRHLEVIMQIDYAPDPIRLHTTPSRY